MAHKLRAALSVLELLFHASLLVLSPLVLILFLVGVIAALDRSGSHQYYVRRLASEGHVAEATVEFNVPEERWVHVTYVDESRQAREGWLDMRYYDASWWDRLVPGTRVPIRHLPWPSQDKVVLEEAFADVQRYQAYLTPDIIGFLLASWLILSYKPQVLYLGLVDFDSLFKNPVPQ